MGTMRKHTHEIEDFPMTTPLTVIDVIQNHIQIATSCDMIFKIKHFTKMLQLQISAISTSY